MNDDVLKAFDCKADELCFCIDTKSERHEQNYLVKQLASNFKYEESPRLKRLSGEMTMTNDQ